MNGNNSEFKRCKKSWDLQNWECLNVTRSSLVPVETSERPREAISQGLQWTSRTMQFFFGVRSQSRNNWDGFLWIWNCMKKSEEANTTKSVFWFIQVMVKIPFQSVINFITKTTVWINLPQFHSCGESCPRTPGTLGRRPGCPRGWRPWRRRGTRGTRAGTAGCRGTWLWDKINSDWII